MEVYNSENRVIAIISDIHGNLEALETVIDSIQKQEQEIDSWICLGDIVGYNPEPNQCVAKIRDLCQHVLAGNHDWAALGRLDINYFNAHARQAVKWTRKRLTGENSDFLSQLSTNKKLKIAGKTIKLGHGTPNPEHPFGYLLSPFDVERVEPFIMEADLTFVGHTHIGGCFYVKDDEYWEFKNAYNGLEETLKSDHTYIINVGSVGQPRDGNPKASYALYYPETGVISINRVKYDVEKVQRKIRETALPGFLADRLAQGR